MAYQPTKAQQHKNGAITHTYLKMLGKMDKNMKNPPWQIKAIDQIRNSLNELQMVRFYLDYRAGIKDVTAEQWIICHL